MLVIKPVPAPTEQFTTTAIQNMLANAGVPYHTALSSALYDSIIGEKIGLATLAQSHLTLTAIRAVLADLDARLAEE